MTSKKRILLFGAASVGLVLLAGTLLSWATGSTIYGIEGESGNVRLTLEPVTYDLSTNYVSGTLKWRDTNGVNRLIASSPTPTFEVLRYNPSTGAMSYASVSCSPTLADGQTISWSFSYAVPSGLIFMGCRVTGNYVNGNSVTREYDSSIGGYADTDQFP